MDTVINFQNCANWLYNCFVSVTTAIATKFPWWIGLAFFGMIILRRLTKLIRYVFSN